MNKTLKNMVVMSACGIAVLGFSACSPDAKNSPSPEVKTSSATQTPVETSASPDNTATASASPSASASASPSKSASATPSSSAPAMADLKKVAECSNNWIDVDPAKLAEFKGLSEAVCSSPVYAVILSDGSAFNLQKEVWQSFASEPTFRGYIATDMKYYGFTTGDDKDLAQKVVDKFGGKVCKLVDSDIEC